MKLSKLSKILKGFKTEIGFIRVGTKVKFIDVYDPFCFGIVKKIENKKAKIDFYNNPELNGKVEINEMYWYGKYTLSKGIFELVK